MAQPAKTNHGIHLAVGSFQGFAAFSLSLPTGLVTAAFLSRQLGPVDYGLLTVAATIVIWIEGAVSMGFNRTAVKFIAGKKDWRPVSTRFLQVQLAVGLLSASLLFFISPVFASLLNADALSYYLRFFSLGIPVTVLFNIHQSILIGQGHFEKRALLIAIYWISRMIFIIIFVGLWPTVTSAVISLIMPYILGLICARFYVNPALFGKSDVPVKKLWDFALPVFFFSIAISLFHRMDLLFVKGLVDLPREAGFYSAAQNLTFVPSMLMVSISPLLLAKLTQYCSNYQRDHAANMIQNTIRILICLLPFAGLTAGTATEVSTAIYGPSFFSSGPLLAVLIFSSLGISIIIVSSGALIAADRPQLAFYLLAPILILGFIAHSLLIPKFGSMGAAAVSTGLSWIAAIIFIGSLYRVWGIRLSMATIIRSVTICICIYCLSVQWYAPGFVVLGKMALMSMLIVIAILLSGELKNDDILFLRSIFNFSVIKNRS